MNENLTLYHYWRSSCSWRVRWALAAKKIEYKAIAVNLLKSEQSAPEFLKRNAMGTVPTLLVGDKPLGESLAIIEWLEETYPTPNLLPKDPIQRAIVRQLSLLIVAGTQPLQNLSVQKYYCPDEKKRMEDGRHWIGRGLKAYEKLVASHHGKFSVGDSVTLADLCLVPQCYNAERFEFDLKSVPIVEQIYRRCRELPDCKASEPVNPEG